MQFNGTVVIVTGAGGGIGKAIALGFGAAGAHTVVNDIGAETTAAVAAEITAGGGSALAHPADISDPAQVDALFAAAVARFGTVDVLVNNAGLTNTERHVLDGDDAWWDRIIKVNLSGSYYCAARAAQIMARKRSGVIINMSSGAGSRAHRGNVAYDATKGGVEMLTRALAVDLGPYGVRVNALAPGSIDSKGMGADIKAKRGQDIPLARVGDPEDMVGPALFLASEHARYITGHILPVDGGLLAQLRSATADIFPLSRYPTLD